MNFDLWFFFLYRRIREKYWLIVEKLHIRFHISLFIHHVNHTVRVNCNNCSVHAARIAIGWLPLEGRNRNFKSLGHFRIETIAWNLSYVVHGENARKRDKWTFFINFVRLKFRLCVELPSKFDVRVCNVERRTYPWIATTYRVRWPAAICR